MKKGLIITGIVLTVLLVIVIFVGALAISGFNKMETNTYEAMKEFDKIEIDTRDTDIIFIPTEDEPATDYNSIYFVETYIINFKVECYERAKSKHKVTIEDGTLKIGYEDNRAWYEHFTFFSRKQTVTIYLPKYIISSLKIDSGTGDISIPSEFTFKSADIRVSTGDVDFEATVKGALNIKTTTGDIDLDGVYTKSADITVTTGDISIRDTNISAHLEITASTGDVHFKNSDAGSIKIKTSTGDVTGTLLTGKQFITNTSTGDIRVPDSKEGGICEIRTSTGDIKIRIEKK